MSIWAAGNFRHLWAMLAVIGGLAFLPAAGLAQSDADIEFRNNGRIVRTVPLSKLAALMPVVTLEIFEIHERRDRSYRAYPARALFDKVLGKGWEQAEEIVFTCADGYQPSVPVAKFLAHDAYFAFADASGASFMLTNRLQNDELVPLGPLYLIWDNVGSPALLGEGAADMPYQVKGIELTTFASRFPNLSPPAGANAQAQSGFLHFRKHCMACHTVNGEGGGKAPELNYPVSVVEYMRPEYLARWLDDPASIRYNTAMPGLARELPDRARISAEIIAYLKAMSMAKRAPGKTP